MIPDVKIGKNDFVIKQIHRWPEHDTNRTEVDMGTEYIFILKDFCKNEDTYIELHSFEGPLQIREIDGVEYLEVIKDTPEDAEDVEPTTHDVLFIHPERFQPFLRALYTMHWKLVEHEQFLLYGTTKRIDKTAEFDVIRKLNNKTLPIK